ncbi:MAG TPA: hypothetical protein VJI97_02845 [Candidatus Nanoarchaeia archaeon]|nr:hypothetical protein [Candidatus Nanoarchaeia archaeon]
MKKCKAPGCKCAATAEWDNMQLCDEHYYEYSNKYKNEWEALLEE